LAPLIIWAEVEVNIAIIFSCAAAFKTLAQSLFPTFMDGLMSGSAGKSRKSRNGTTRNTYMLRSQDRVDNSRFRTVIEAAPPTRHDGGSVDSRERIVDEAATATAGWPIMKTTISVHSSKRESEDGNGGEEKRVESFLIE
jgi:hypothetical protein